MASSRNTELDLSLTIGESSFSGSGKSDVVMSALERFLGAVGEDDSAVSPTVEKPVKPPAKRQTKRRTSNAQAPNGSSATPIQVVKEPLPALLKKLDLRGNKKIGTAVVAWAAVNDGKSVCSVAEVRGYWRRTPLKAPANLNRDLEDAAKAGWLNKTDDGYSLTGFGKSEVGLT